MFRRLILVINVEPPLKWNYTFHLILVHFTNIKDATRKVKAGQAQHKTCSFDRKFASMVRRHSTAKPTRPKRSTSGFLYFCITICTCCFTLLLRLLFAFCRQPFSNSAIICTLYGVIEFLVVVCWMKKWKRMEKLRFLICSMQTSLVVEAWKLMFWRPQTWFSTVNAFLCWESRHHSMNILMDDAWEKVSKSRIYVVRCCARWDQNVIKYLCRITVNLIVISKLVLLMLMMILVDRPNFLLVLVQVMFQFTQTI